MNPNRNILQLFENGNQLKNVNAHMSQNGDWDDNDPFGPGDDIEHRDFDEFHGGVRLSLKYGLDLG